MGRHTAVLVQLATELFAPTEFEVLRPISLSHPLDLAGLARFDRSIGGPSIDTIANPKAEGGILGIPEHGTGRYEISDRAVFRPLQYCSVYFTSTPKHGEWLTRDIVEMSSLHVEALVKRIGKLSHLPLGTAVRKAKVKSILAPTTWCQVVRFSLIYNEAKHCFDQDMDTHLFSVEDAVLAYLVSRRLGQKLYPLASLSTDQTVFSEGL